MTRRPSRSGLDEEDALIQAEQQCPADSDARERRCGRLPGGWSRTSPSSLSWLSPQASSSPAARPSGANRIAAHAGPQQRPSRAYEWSSDL